MAYYLAGNGNADDIYLWLERYEKVARKVLPKWARRKSRRYLRQVYGILNRGFDPEPLLLEFKQFLYGTFCRALMERHNESRANS